MATSSDDDSTRSDDISTGDLRVTRVEAELRRVRHLRALAAETARVGSWTYDPLDGALVVDDRWRELHGLGEVPSRLDGLFGALEDEHAIRVREELDAVFGGAAEQSDLEYETAPGRWTLTRLRRLAGEDVGVVIATAVDITAQKRSEHEATERVALQQLLLGVVSHDLKSPLQTILTALELLPELGEVSRGQKKAIRRAEGAAGRAQRLVWDLLDVARHRLTGEVPLKVQEVSVAALVEEVVGAARLRSEEEARIDVQVADGARARVDPDRFAQVLVNLLDNAIEHGEGATITVRAELTDQHLLLTVHNPDSVIPPSALPDVFSPFEQADEGTVRGSGLGLHIVRLLTEAHGGRATVTSSVEAGTTFRTSWPRSDPSGTSSGA